MDVRGVVAVVSFDDVQPRQRVDSFGRWHAPSGAEGSSRSLDLREVDGEVGDGEEVVGATVDDRLSEQTGPGGTAPWTASSATSSCIVPVVDDMDEVTVLHAVTPVGPRRWDRSSTEEIKMVSGRFRVGGIGVAGAWMVIHQPFGGGFRPHDSGGAKKFSPSTSLTSRGHLVGVRAVTRRCRSRCFHVGRGAGASRPKCARSGGRRRPWLAPAAAPVVANPLPRSDR